MTTLITILNNHLTPEVILDDYLAGFDRPGPGDTFNGPAGLVPQICDVLKSLGWRWKRVLNGGPFDDEKNHGWTFMGGGYTDVGIWQACSVARQWLREGAAP